jgi:hypothetical protein
VNQYCPRARLFVRELSSVGIATGYWLDGRGSIFSRAIRLFSIPQHLFWIWGPRSLLFNWYQGTKRPGRDVTSMVEQHLNPPYVLMMCCAGTTSPLPLNSERTISDRFCTWILCKNVRNCEDEWGRLGPPFRTFWPTCLPLRVMPTAARTLGWFEPYIRRSRIRGEVDYCCTHSALGTAPGSVGWAIFPIAAFTTARAVKSEVA